jgi:hypothetical protein
MAEDYSINFPSAEGGGGGTDWEGLFGGGLDLFDQFSNLFGSPSSTTSQRRIAPPSFDELTLQGYGLDQLYNQGPNPAYSYGIGGQADLLEGGMRASPAQLGYLGDIRRNTIDMGTSDINDWLDQALGRNRNTMLGRGMDQSSVELWGQDQSTKEAVRQLANLVSGANVQYATGATELPYKTAGVYGNVATLGQQEGNQNMQNIIQWLQTLQAPRMAEVGDTTQNVPGSAERGSQIADIGKTVLPWILSAF